MTDLTQFGDIRQQLSDAAIADFIAEENYQRRGEALIGQAEWDDHQSSFDKQIAAADDAYWNGILQWQKPYFPAVSQITELDDTYE